VSFKLHADTHTPGTMSFPASSSSPSSHPYHPPTLSRTTTDQSFQTARSHPSPLNSPGTMSSWTSSSTATTPRPQDRSGSITPRTTTYFPTQPEALVLQDGPVSERAAEALARLVDRDASEQEFTAHAHVRDGGHNHDNGNGEDEGGGGVGVDDAYWERVEYAKGLPWYKRASPWWYVLVLSSPPSTTLA
jgi:hypothetical protein